MGLLGGEVGLEKHTKPKTPQKIKNKNKLRFLAEVEKQMHYLKIKSALIELHNFCCSGKFNALVYLL